MYIRRELEDKIIKYLNAPEIIAITGARQSGKTTLLRHIKDTLPDAAFLTFEDLETRLLFDTDINSFVKLYIKPYRYIFIDEFQYAKEGGPSLKFIYDTVKDKKIIISGSSTVDITIKAVKHLAGRVFVFVLYPLSLMEFLSFKDPQLYDHLNGLDMQTALQDVLISKYSRCLNDFILYGGYPRVALSSDDEEKKEVLRNIVNIYLLKDIKDIIALSDDYKMHNLIKALALQIGGVISYQELTTITTLSAKSVKNYLNLLQKTFVTCIVHPFYTNKRLEIVKNPKVYFYDTGLRNAIINDYRELSQRQDRGFLYENFVLNELTKRGYNLKYWRTKSKAEVDFVVDDRHPVEVKSHLSRPNLGKSLFSFAQKYQPARAFVFNEDLLCSEVIDTTEVRFIYHFYCPKVSFS